MNYCECDNCRALDEPTTNPSQKMSRRMLIFYNDVAEQLEKTHPKARILAGAYHIYTEPPMDKSLKAHPMLSVIICHYSQYCLAHSVADPKCEKNESYRQLIADWLALTGSVYFYEYYCKGEWYGLPWPIVHSIASDIPYFRRLGCKGLYTQWTSQDVWTNGLAYYVAAKLLWNSKENVAALVDDFCNKLFGESASAMKKYYSTLEHATANAGRCIGGNSPLNAPAVFTDEVLKQLTNHLEEAQRLAHDSKVKRRLAKVAISLEYTKRVCEFFQLEKNAGSGKEAALKALAAVESICRDVIVYRVLSCG